MDTRSLEKQGDWHKEILERLSESQILSHLLEVLKVYRINEMGLKLVRIIYKLREIIQKPKQTKI